jgi:hypothetical protein
MHHLNLEALARLVDEAPDADEATHLRDCLVCRRELDCLRDQTLALAELPPMEPSPGAWSALESRLLDEALIRSAAPMAAAPAYRRPALRIAASLALFLAGGAAGAVAWGRWNAVPQDHLAQLPPSRVSEPVQVPVAGPLEVRDPVVLEQPMMDGAGVRHASMTSSPEPRPAARPRPARAAGSPAVLAAERELEDAEAAYLTALRRYAELADPAAGADPVTRLEALDRLVEMSARALDRSPDDPQLNGYHLAAVNERDALRRQIQRAAETTWF